MENAHLNAVSHHSQATEGSWLTSILQVMIPGSLPTALKALLRDMVLVFPGLKHHRARGDTPCAGHQSSFPPKSVLNLIRHPAVYFCYAHPHTSRQGK